MGPVLGPHARTDCTRDTLVSEPRLPAPEHGRPGEGQRLTPDAPHNGGRSAPPGTAPHHPRGTRPPQGMQAKGTVLGPHTHTPAPTARGWRTPTARPVGGWSGEGQRLTSDAPHNGGRRPPRGRPSATPRAGNAGPQGRTLSGRCWVPTPARPHPGHTGRGTLAARSRGRAAGGGTAPDTRRPSQRWQATPPGDGPPPPPRHAAPTGHASQGDGVGPPHPHTRAHSTWVADPNSPPSGRAVGGGTAPDLRRPSQWWKAPPPGTPSRHPHSEQRQPAGTHAVGPLLGPHARTDRTRDTRVAEPWLPAPEDGRPGEGQRLTPDAPRNGIRPPPPGTPFCHPHSEQRRPGKAHAVGPVLGPHARTDRNRDTRVAEPRLPAPEDGRPGEGQRLTPDTPHNGGRPPPRGRPPTTPAARSPDRACEPRGQCWAPTPTHPRPQHVGGGPQQPAGWAGGWGRDSASPQAPLTMVEGGPPGTPFRHPHSEQRRPARAHAVGPVLGPTPAPASPGTHGSPNPGCRPQRAGGRGRDSA